MSSACGALLTFRAEVRPSKCCTRARSLLIMCCALVMFTVFENRTETRLSRMTTGDETATAAKQTRSTVGNIEGEKRGKALQPSVPSERLYTCWEVSLAAVPSLHVHPVQQKRFGHNAEIADIARLL
jgi:hypothetical protein